MAGLLLDLTVPPTSKVLYTEELDVGLRPLVRSAQVAAGERTKGADGYLHPPPRAGTLGPTGEHVEPV